MDSTSWAWEATARSIARRLGVSADEIAVDVHTGNDRGAWEVNAEQMWAPVIRRLHQIEDACRR